VSQTPFREHREAIEAHIEQVLDSCPYPTSLYDPIRYVMRIGGKRVRPLLVMLAAGTLGRRDTAVLDVAVAVELLHNFTLVHDDIMDRDDVRRGHPTIHSKWDEGTAILAGDALIGVAYRCLSRIEHSEMGELIRTFTDAVVEVCEGQALDKEFEGRDTVTLAEYEDMIARKTGRLLSMSARIGGLAAQGSPQQVDALEAFGAYLGKAFQIQDDLLDYMSTTDALGKAVGSDLAMHKSTFVTLMAKQMLSGNSLMRLNEILANGSPDLVGELQRLLTDGGVLAEGERQVEELVHKAEAALADMPSAEGVSQLLTFANWILRRTF
jgi:geranylgeranyl diphosphate synthase type II